jgi:hypothetical protein
MSPSCRPVLVAHADWSVDARKRWVAVARQAAGAWRLSAPVAVGEIALFIDRLRRDASGQATALGIDMPLGLPRAYAARRPEVDFPHFLKTLANRPEFFRVCASVAELTLDRPFYPVHGERGMTRAAHAAALGFDGAAALSRACDRATMERPAGAPLFWTLGANQTGKAAITGWREMLAPALADDEPIRLWPYQGPFRELLDPATVTIGETYPAEALRHLGLRLIGSKRRRSDRAAVGASLRAAMDRLEVQPEPDLAVAIETGFGSEATGEDRFDCTLGVLCVLNVLAGHRPDTCPDDPWIKHWEGWVLGQTALRLNRNKAPPCAPAP